MVKIYPGGECPNLGEGVEDSDCESFPEPPAASLLEAGIDGKEEKEPASLPVLTMGSFTRCAWNLRWGLGSQLFFGQLEILVFLHVYGRYTVCTPEISRHRCARTTHTRAHSTGQTSSVFAKGNLLPRNCGES